MLFFCELYVIRDELALLGRTAHHPRSWASTSYNCNRSWASINRPPTGGDLTFSWKEGHICTVVLLEVLSQLCHGGGGVQALSVVGGRQSRTFR